MADTPASARPRGVSRRNFVTGVGAAGVGGLVVGGAAGWAIKPSRRRLDVGGPSGGPIKIGSVAPITGPYSGDGQEMVRGAEMAVDGDQRRGRRRGPHARAGHRRHLRPGAGELHPGRPATGVAGKGGRGVLRLHVNDVGRVQDLR